MFRTYERNDVETGPTPIIIGGFYANKFNLYFMIIYLCIKYDSNILIFSEDIKQKPFFVRMDWTDGCTYR